MESRDPFSNKRLILLAFVLILILAGFLRFYALNLAQFRGDEASISSYVRDMVQHGQIPLVGPSLSSGGNDGPISYYLLAIPFILSTDPLVMTGFVAAVNILGILVAFKFAKEFFNIRIALIASALDGVSPFAVLFSRKIWAPNLVFPFVTILIYCVYRFAVGKKGVYVIPIFVFYSLVLELHSVTLFLSPLVLFIVLKYHSQVRPKHLVVAVALSLVVFSPMIYGQVTGGFKEGGAFVSVLHYYGRYNAMYAPDMSSVTSGTGFGYVLGSSANQFYTSLVGTDLLFPVEDVAFLLGLAVVVFKAIKEPSSERAKYWILALWIAVPALMLIDFSPPFFLPHELTMLFPVNFLVIAIMFDSTLKQLSGSGGMSFLVRTAKVALVVILATMLASQVVFNVAFLNLISTQGGTTGDYDVGLQYKMEVASYVSLNSNGSAFTISSDLVPGQIDSEYYYLLSLYGRAPSNSAALGYVVINNLTQVDHTLLQQLSDDKRVSFGPLTVYSLKA